MTRTRWRPTFTHLSCFPKDTRALAADLGRPIADIPQLHFVDMPLDARHDVDALLVLTEWKCFHHPDFAAMAGRMRAPVIFDGRNLFDPAQMQELGFVYQGIGRRNRAARQGSVRRLPLASSRAERPG